MANIITSCRILCSIALLFCPAFSPAFYALYLIAGFTDMIDGTVARKTNSVSEFGSKLDTIADWVFVAVCLIKMLPVMDIPIWLWIWIVVIAVIKTINVVLGFIVQKKFEVKHTIINKTAGLLLFILPLTLPIIDLNYSAIVICAVVTIAAVQEMHYIRIGRAA